MTYRPIAVIAGDIHFNLNTLALADAGIRMAIATANELHVPFIANGDTHDTKANMRGECVNAMISAFQTCETPPYITVGNHDRISEKAPAHALNFLAPYAMIIDKPVYQHHIGHIIPYYHNADELRAHLSTIKSGSRLVMHQGIIAAEVGEYIQDKSALNKEDLAPFRTILSHYHCRQDIQCGPLKDNNVGMASYIGNLYTTSYAEANDPPKGYQILYSDGSLEFKPTNLREHRVLDYTVHEMETEALFLGEEQDLVWVKIRGTKEELAKVTKQKVARDLDIMQSFRLDLIPTDTITQAPDARLNLSEGPLLDSLIDSLSNTSDERKIRLKSIWKSLK